MRWQTTASLAVILLLLGGFYYVYEIRLGPEREKAQSRKGQMFSAEAGNVTEVEIKRGPEVLKFQREGEGWRMLAPIQARGDRGAVDELITSVLTAKIDREIAASPASLAEFGLDAPKAEVTLTLKDGRRLGVQLGAKNPTGVWVYGREEGKAAVVALPDSVLRDASRPVADYRDKTVLTFDRSAVTGLDITTPDESLGLVTADGKWKLTRPADRAADSDVVTDFLEKLGAARVKEFVAEAPPASLQSYGLDRPLRVDVQTGRDKDRATKTLLVGRLDAAKQGVYAMRPGEPSVLLLPEDVWKALPKNAAVLRDKTVVAFDRDKVAKIEIDGAHGSVTLARENNQWRIVAPEAVGADQVEAGALLRKLSELKAQAFLTEDASGIPRFLAKPELRLTITAEGGAATTLLLAPSPERRGSQPSAYAAVAGSGPLVLVDAGALKDLGRTVNDLRDRRLLGEVEPKDVKRVAIKRGGKSVVLERQGDNEWRMVEPSKGAAKSSKVEDLLYTARALKWKDIVAPRGEEPARYGLDAPELEITLGRGDGSEIGTVLVGKREGDRIFVRTKTAPTIYTIEARQLGDLPNVDDFKG
ncbi:MAG: DUF4340 domain-containing protein [Candidatus Rokuibacteriota bacterium]